MTPFERWFAEEFKQLLDTVEGEPGLFSCPTSTLDTASWDRKAAYLLWNAKGRPGDTWEV